MHTEALPEGGLTAVIICCLQHDHLVTTFFLTCLSLSSPCDMLLAWVGVCSMAVNEHGTLPGLGSQAWLYHCKLLSVCNAPTFLPTAGQQVDTYIAGAQRLTGTVPAAGLQLKA